MVVGLQADQVASGQTPTSRPEKKRRVMSYVGPEPSVEQIEAEFWRIVETPDDIYESLYGQVRTHPLPNSGARHPPKRPAPLSLSLIVLLILALWAKAGVVTVAS